jgi:hypothetical protein
MVQRREQTGSGSVSRRVVSCDIDVMLYRRLGLALSYCDAECMGEALHGHKVLGLHGNSGHEMRVKDIQTARSLL